MFFYTQNIEEKNKIFVKKVITQKKTFFYFIQSIFLRMMFDLKNKFFCYSSLLLTKILYKNKDNYYTQNIEEKNKIFVKKVIT